MISLKAYKGLAEIAVKCLCELLVALPHFNFHNNIIVLVVPLMNDTSKQVSIVIISYDFTRNSLCLVLKIHFEATILLVYPLSVS